MLLADATLNAPPAVIFTSSSVNAVTLDFCTLTATAAAAETLPSEDLAERPLSFPASAVVAPRCEVLPTLAFSCLVDADVSLVVAVLSTLSPELAGAASASLPSFAPAAVAVALSVEEETPIALNETELAAPVALILRSVVART